MNSVSSTLSSSYSAMSCPMSANQLNALVNSSSVPGGTSAAPNVSQSALNLPLNSTGNVGTQLNLLA